MQVNPLLKTAFPAMVFENPKVYADVISTQESRLFPYYAGYANSFAESALTNLGLDKTALIFDPWNGSGTTTTAAARLGYASIGQDLNPVMVLVAKAALLRADSVRVERLASVIIASASASDRFELAERDPLETWFSPSSAVAIRKLEAVIHATLVSDGAYCSLLDKVSLGSATSLAAFFYVVLFRVVRHLLVDFVPSNPTWVKSPSSLQARKRPSDTLVQKMFADEVKLLIGRLSKTDNKAPYPATEVILGNAEVLGLADASIDAVITSPPYCTRIDYAVATSIELAVLRASTNDFGLIRRSLMGTSTVVAQVDVVNPMWGASCTSFLSSIYDHPSKSSKTYYFKSHWQYFSSLYNSIKELARVLKGNGRCILVVQDSYYKDLHNDLGQIATEMALSAGFSIETRQDFPSARSISAINRHARGYVANRITNESVLCFVRR